MYYLANFKNFKFIDDHHVRLLEVDIKCNYVQDISRPIKMKHNLKIYIYYGSKQSTTFNSVAYMNNSWSQ